MSEELRCVSSAEREVRREIWGISKRLGYAIHGIEEAGSSLLPEVRCVAER